MSEKEIPKTLHSSGLVATFLLRFPSSQSKEIALTPAAAKNR